MERFTKNIIDWLQRMLIDTESKDPKLRPMKDQINEISKQIEFAKEDEVPNLVKLQSEAIKTLVSHIASKQ
jgi:hypothetical protein